MGNNNNNKQQSAGEQMVSSINGLFESFNKFKAETESKLNPEQKLEYDKHLSEKGADKAIEDVKNKMEELRTMVMTGKK